MPKCYVVSAYRSVSNPDAFANHAKPGGPAIVAAGGRFLARGMPVRIYEVGLQQRTVIIEFKIVESARATYGSPAYQEALAALGNGAERDIRIVEACECRLLRRETLRNGQVDLTDAGLTGNHAPKRAS